MTAFFHFFFVRLPRPGFVPSHPLHPSQSRTTVKPSAAKATGRKQPFVCVKVHRAWEPGLLESTSWLSREWRPPWDQRREAHGQSVMNGFVVLLRALGVFAVNLLSSLHTDGDKRLWFYPGNPPAPRRERPRNSLHVITFRQSPMA